MSVNVPPKMTLEEAESLLKQRLASQVVGLRVRIQEAGITLQGTAYSYYAKQLAQHGAMHILGLPILANEIEVRLNPRSTPIFGASRPGRPVWGTGRSCGSR